MASLLSWGKKKWESSVVRDAFSADTEADKQRRGGQPHQPGPSITSQVNNLLRPMAQKALRNSPVGQAGRLVENIANEIPEVPADNPLRFLNTALIRPIKTTDVNIGRLAQGENPWEGSLKQQAGQATQDIINMASVVPIGKGVQLATKGLPAIKQGASTGIKVGAGFGGAQGASTSLQNELNLQDTLKTIGLSTGIGAGAGLTLGAGLPLAGAGVRGIGNRVKPLDQAGSIRLPNIGKQSPSDSLPNNTTLSPQAQKATAQLQAIIDNPSAYIPTYSPPKQSIASKIWSGVKPLDEGGFVKIPGGAKDPAPDLQPKLPLQAQAPKIKTPQIAPEKIAEYQKAVQAVNSLTGYNKWGYDQTGAKDWQRRLETENPGIEKVQPTQASKPKLPVSSLPNSKQQSLESLVKAPIPPITVKTPTVPLKTRGFKKNLFKSNFYKGDPVLKEVIDSIPGYKPLSNQESYGKAAAEIGKDYNSAYARIATKPQLTDAHDVATANILLRDTIERGDTEASTQLGKKLGVDATKLAQAVQAYAGWKKTTPEGVLRFAIKKAGSAGRELDPAVARQLTDRAKKIASMPEGFEKARATRELLGEAEKQGSTHKDLANEIFNVPRAAMATADFSAPLRQGGVLGSRFPNQFRKAFTESAKYMFKPEYYEKEMYKLTQRPTYSLMKSRKLAVDAAEELTGTEEQFLGSILEGKVAKKLGFGHVVAASDRAYSGFLTRFRADVFDKVLVDTKQAGVKLDNKSLDSLTKFINSASGRGSGRVTDQVSRLQVLFSARLWKSRLDVLNPAYYARLDPTARKYALQSAASFAGITTTMLGLAKASGMADVNADPRSADFGKIKVGNTRYDILGGLQQNIRIAAQLVTGEKINSSTGEVQTLGADRGFGKPSRLDILYQFVENKENPIIAFGTKALRGTDPIGNKLNLASEAGKLFVPLTAQSVYSTAKDVGSIPKAVGMNIPGTFGVGVQTYGGEKYKDTKQAGKQGEVKALKNGRFEAKIGDNNKSFDTKEDAEKAVFVDKFKKGDVKVQEFGKNVYLKNDKNQQGYSVKSKIDYEFDKVDSQASLEMDRAKARNDVEGWLTNAEKKYQALETKKQSYDPEIESDKIADITLKQENLLEQASKYEGYGGFKKGRVARSGRGGSRAGGGRTFSTSGFKTASSNKISAPKGISIRKPTYKSGKTKKLAVSKIPKLA